MKKNNEDVANTEDKSKKNKSEVDDSVAILANELVTMVSGGTEPPRPVRDEPGQEAQDIGLDMENKK